MDHRMKYKKPPLRLQPTTLWDYPSQHYGDAVQGDPNYKGATPSYIIWNLLSRYTKPNELVIDPFCGSGTTLDVARDLGSKGARLRRASDARRHLPRRRSQAAARSSRAKSTFVFIDPPYSTHLDYGPDPRDIGKLSAAGGEYYPAMERVFDEIARVLRPGKHMALYVSDSYEHNKSGGVFHPIGFELFQRLQQRLTPVDSIAVIRHNKTLEQGNYRAAAEQGNFFLRGFNHLFIFRKPIDSPAGDPPKDRERLHVRRGRG